MLRSHLACSSILFFACTGFVCIGGLDVPFDEEGDDESVTAVESGLVSDRSVMVSRAQRWVTLDVPYSQTSYFEGYQQDCVLPRLERD